MSYILRSNASDEYIFDFLFHDISACVLEFTSEKQNVFGKRLEETR